MGAGVRGCGQDYVHTDSWNPAANFRSTSIARSLSLSFTS